ncbi:MAG: membrane protein insertion efficiency factor YidD [Enterobacteriaceae bacterium]
MIRKVLIIFIKIYQILFNLVLRKKCRYSITCSNYSINVINKHGIFFGFFYTLKRLLKCNVLTKKF